MVKWRSGENEHKQIQYETDLQKQCDQTAKSRNTLHFPAFYRNVSVDAKHHEGCHRLQTYGATNFIALYHGVLFDRIQNAVGCLLMLFGYIPDKGLCHNPLPRKMPPPDYIENIASCP